MSKRNNCLWDVDTVSLSNIMKEKWDLSSEEWKDRSGREQWWQKSSELVILDRKNIKNETYEWRLVEISSHQKRQIIRTRSIFRAWHLYHCDCRVTKLKINRGHLWWWRTKELSPKDFLRPMKPMNIFSSKYG